VQVTIQAEYARLVYIAQALCKNVHG